MIYPALEKSLQLPMPNSSIFPLASTPTHWISVVLYCGNSYQDTAVEKTGPRSALSKEIIRGVDHQQLTGELAAKSANYLNFVRGCNFCASGSVVLMDAGYSRRIHRRLSSLFVACINDCRHIEPRTILVVWSDFWRHVRGCVSHDWLRIHERPQTVRVWT